MDYSKIVKVIETHDPDDVNVYLATGRWSLFGEPCVHPIEGGQIRSYSLCWFGPADHERPELDESEFPPLPEKGGKNIPWL